MKTEYTQEQKDQAAAEAKELIEDNIVGKKTDDFLMISAKDRAFLFQMRYHFLNHIEQGKPFFCTPPQLKYLKGVLTAVAVDGGESKKIEDAFKESVRSLKKKLSPAISEQTKELAEKLGMDRRALRRELERRLYGQS